jgi:hypothetical protein
VPTVDVRLRDYLRYETSTALMVADLCCCEFKLCEENPARVVSVGFSPPLLLVRDKLSRVVCLCWQGYLLAMTKRPKDPRHTATQHRARRLPAQARNSMRKRWQSET